MKIAIFSDSHDHLSAMAWATQKAQELGISQAIHLGDFCSPPIVSQLADCGLHVTAVWGNCDGDKLLCYRRVVEKATIDFADGDFREFQIDGKKLFLTHYPQIARLAALSGQYDACFYGHDHEAHSEMIANTLYANPGEIAGTKTGKISFGIYDTESNNLQHLYKD